jgi:hypothetical protein
MADETCACVLCVLGVGGGGKFSMQRFRLFFTNRHGAYKALPPLAFLAADACFVAAIFSSALILAGKYWGGGGKVRVFAVCGAKVAVVLYEWAWGL